MIRVLDHGGLLLQCLHGSHVFTNTFVRILGNLNHLFGNVTGLLDSMLNGAGHLALFFNTGSSHIGSIGNFLHTVGYRFRCLYQLVHEIRCFGGLLMYSLGYIKDIIQYFFYMHMLFLGRTDSM